MLFSSFSTSSRWLLPLLVVNLALPGYVDLATHDNTYSAGKRPGIDQVLPNIMRSLDRIQTADPFHVIRNLQREKVNKSIDLTLPEPLSEQDVDLITHLLETDEHNLLATLVSDLSDGQLGLGSDSRSIARFILTVVIGRMSPIVGVSEQCKQQSIAYFLGLFNVIAVILGGDTTLVWANTMIDTSGKSFSGLWSDDSDLCEDFYTGTGELCQSDFYRKLFPPIPVGNTIALGSFEGCLKVKSQHVFPPKTPAESHLARELLKYEDFRGQYCVLNMEYAPAKPGPFATKTRPTTEALAGWQANLAALDKAMNATLNEGSAQGGVIPPVAVDLIEMYLESFLRQMDLRWGQCIPSGCSKVDVETHYQRFYTEILGLPLKATPLSCETEETQRKVREFDTASIIGFALFGFLVFFIGIGTLVDAYQQIFQSANSEKSDLVVTQDQMMEHAKQEPRIVSFLKYFSVDINGRKVLNTEVDKGKDHLRCLDALRVISNLWIILFHIFYIVSIMRPAFIQNKQKLSDVWLGEHDVSIAYEVLANGVVAVNSFFFISGLVLAYRTFIEMEQNVFNLKTFYVRRYLRLTVPLALSILFVVAYVPQMGGGPNFGHYLAQNDLCRDNWWYNLLYVQNFLAPDQRCMNATWYLATEMQMFLLSPLVMVPLYKWQKEKHYNGLKVWGLAATLATVVPIALTWGYNLRMSHLFVEDASHQTNPAFDMDQHLFVMPWGNLQPYLMGILTGYILFKLRGQEVKINQYVSLFLWLVSLATLFGVTFGLHHARLGSTFVQRSYSVFDSVMYNGFSRLAWSMALAWMTVACVKGYGGPINSFLSWGFFTPLSRMSYMSYLVHFDLCMLFFSSLTYSIEVTDIILCYYFVSLAMVSYGIAFVGTMTIEFPFTNLTRLLLGHTKASAIPKTSERKNKAEDNNGLRIAEVKNEENGLRHLEQK